MELAPTPSHIYGPTWQRWGDGSWYLPKYTLGWGVLRWLWHYCRQPGGQRAGKNFKPTMEQARFLLWWYAVDENGRFVYRSGLLRRMKGWGKDPLAAAMALVELCGPTVFSHWDLDGQPVGTTHAAPWVQVAAVSHDQPLTLDTVVHTGRGDTPLSGIREGDRVFGSDGKLHDVLGVTDVMHQESYRLTFDDGVTVDASANHAWTVEQLNGKRHGFDTVTCSTQGLFDTYQSRRVRIPLVPRESPDVPLRVSPYLLGYWLGDGNQGNGAIAVGNQDYSEVYSLLEQEISENCHLVPRKAYGWDVYVKGNSRKHISFRQDLQVLGVLNNKHVPDEYLNSGTEQRRALLQGLLDSDGCATKQGNIQFTNTNWDLVTAVRDLARSLGHKPSIRRHGTSGHIVSWTPVDECALFRIQRKRINQGVMRHPYRRLRSVEPIGTQPVACISVGSPDRLFQVNGGVLTHNTRNTFTLFPAMASKELRQEFGLEVHKTIIYARDGGLIEGVTSSPTALDGKRPTLVIMNEIQWWLENNQGHDMYNVIEGNVTKSAGGQARYLAIFNAHVPGQDSIAEMLHDNYHLVESGQAIDTGILYDALEAPADTPVSDIPSILDDPEGHQAGVDKLREGIDIARGDSVWLDLNTIVNAVLDVNNPVSESRRKYLNQINATEDSWIAPTEWDAVQSDVTLQPKDKITLGFDGSKTQDTTAIVACRVEDGAMFLVKLWNPDNYEGEVPREDVDATVHSLFEKYDVVGFRADVAEFEAYVDQWGQQYKKKIQIKAAPNAPVAFDMRGQKKQFALDCERFLDAVCEGELTHDGDKLLKSHITNAHRNPTNYDAISIRKASKDSSRKIDAAVCSVLAFGSRHDYLMSKKNRSKKARVYG